MEKIEKFQFDLHLAFVDYEKTFDSLKHKFLINSLHNQGGLVKVDSDYKRNVHWPKG